MIMNPCEDDDLVKCFGMVKNKAFCFKLEPNKEQKVLVDKTLGCTRFIYNHFLALKKSTYNETSKNISYGECSKALTALKKEYSWLREPDSIALQQTLRHLDIAFQNFFQNESNGYPAFKSRHKSEASYTTLVVNKNIQIKDNKIRLPKLGWVKMRMHRYIPDTHTVKSVTIRRTATMKYHISILTEYTDINMSTVPFPETIIGLDFAMNGLFVDSNGDSGSYPRYYRESQEKLAKEQRKLSHMVKGSNNYKRQKQKIAKLYEKIRNQRKDYLHKKTFELAEKYSIICIEDLNMKDMSKSLHLGKSVHDNSWRTFTNLLMYKLEDRGKYLIKISKWYPSSKTCSSCGNIKEGLELSDRKYICYSCGHVMDRDENASINIRKKGIDVFFKTKIPITLVDNRGTHGDSSLKLSS